jgi:cysteine synthase
MRAAEGLKNAVWANQFDNTANQQAHYESTGRAHDILLLLGIL